MKFQFLVSVSMIQTLIIQRATVLKSRALAFTLSLIQAID